MPYLDRRLADFGLSRMLVSDTPAGLGIPDIMDKSFLLTGAAAPLAGDATVVYCVYCVFCFGGKCRCDKRLVSSLAVTNGTVDTIGNTGSTGTNG